MKRRDLERIRDLLEPFPPERSPHGAGSYNMALASFREFVAAVLRAHELGLDVKNDVEDLLGMYGDLASERDSLEREYERAMSRAAAKAAGKVSASPAPPPGARRRSGPSPRRPARRATGSRRGPS